MGEFEALTFEELFDKTYALPWDQWITSDGKFTVLGKIGKVKTFQHLRLSGNCEKSSGRKAKVQISCGMV